jgi:hypothetical protein
LVHSVHNREHKTALALKEYLGAKRKDRSAIDLIYVTVLAADPGVWVYREGSNPHPPELSAGHYSQSRDLDLVSGAIFCGGDRLVEGF